jgi:hypothetical protein
MHISRPHSAHRYSRPGASIGKAAIGVLLGTRKACLIRPGVHCTISGVLKICEKRQTSCPFTLPTLPLLPLFLYLSYLSFLRPLSFLLNRGRVSGDLLSKTILKFHMRLGEIQRILATKVYFLITMIITRELLPMQQRVAKFDVNL